MFWVGLFGILVEFLTPDNCRWEIRMIVPHLSSHYNDFFCFTHWFHLVDIRMLPFDGYRNYRPSLPALKIKILSAIQMTILGLSSHYDDFFLLLPFGWQLDIVEFSMRDNCRWKRNYHPSLPAGLWLWFKSYICDASHFSLLGLFFWLRKFVGIRILSNSRCQITVDGIRIIILNSSCSLLRFKI